MSSTCPHNMANLDPLDPSGSLGPGRPYKFQRVLRLCSVTARHLVVGVSQSAALNRGRHLCSAGRPSGWALAHILVLHASRCTKFYHCLITVTARALCNTLYENTLTRVMYFMERRRRLRAALTRSPPLLRSVCISKLRFWLPCYRSQYGNRSATAGLWLYRTQL